MKKQISLIMLMLMAVSILFVSCEKDTNITNKIYTPSETAFQRLTEQGWLAFSQGNYEQAIDSFELAKQTNSLYMDAYNGLGWAYARLDSLSLAQNYFTMCMVSEENEQVFKDACAGRSFVNLALNDYIRAIEDVNNAIRDIDESGYYYVYNDYVFRHEPDITRDDLLLVMAESYFMTGNYDSCFTILVLIDDTLEETTDPEELAIIIEELKTII